MTPWYYCAGRGLAVAAALVGLASVGGCPFDDLNDEEEAEATLPDFSAAKFSNPSVIDNPFLPFSAGTTQTMRTISPAGEETVVVTVLAETRTIAGIECRVVRDTVTSAAGRVIEDTYDWYAQDDDGNVWYMGEDVTDYVYDDAGNVIEIAHDGSWEAGKDVAGVGRAAFPGFAMPGAPLVGDFYYQEYYVGEAQDQGQVVALDVPIMLSDGSAHRCLIVRDVTPLDAAASELKYYARGAGLVRIEASSEVVERVEP